MTRMSPRTDDETRSGGWPGSVDPELQVDLDQVGDGRRVGPAGLDRLLERLHPHEHGLLGLGALDLEPAEP